MHPHEAKEEATGLPSVVPPKAERNPKVHPVTHVATCLQLSTCMPPVLTVGNRIAALWGTAPTASVVMVSGRSHDVT